MGKKYLQGDKKTESRVKSEGDTSATDLCPTCQANASMIPEYPQDIFCSGADRVAHCQ